MKAPFLMLIATLLVAGCTSTTARREPIADVRTMQHFWVERRLADNHGIDAILTRELRALGREADFGPLTMMPERGVQAVIIYEDHWDWNFGDHLSELRVTVRDPRNQKLLATAVYSHPVGFGSNPVTAAQEVLKKLLGVGSATPVSAKAP